MTDAETADFIADKIERLITGGLQAFIFVLLSIIYLQAAVAVEHEDEHDEHGHGASGHHEPAAA